MRAVLSALVSLCAALFVACGGGNPPPSHPAPVIQPQPVVQPQPPAEERPAATLNAEQLYTEWHDNQPKFQETYDRKLVVVSGTVHRVTKDYLSGRESFLKFRKLEKYELFYPRCFFVDSRVLTGLEPGQQVTLRGRVGINQTVMELRDCELIK